jgi:cytochrome c peroxidase
MAAASLTRRNHDFSSIAQRFSHGCDATVPAKSWHASRRRPGRDRAAPCRADQEKTMKMPHAAGRGLLLVALCAPPLHADGAEARQMDEPSCDGEPCGAVLLGLAAFLDRNLRGLGGNGRACADCHMPGDDFQLSPASAEARFRRLMRLRRHDPRADDPLFRPIDADDFRSEGSAASDFSNLRENGLVRVTLALPPNIRLVDPATNLASAETSVDLWRMVPSVDNVALTGPDSGVAWPRGPNRQGGYQLDARFTTLRDQALAALVSHAEIDDVPAGAPLDALAARLDALASFQRVLFSSDRMRRLSNAIRAGELPLPDQDPPLNPLERAGKTVFTRACAQCHGGPGQSTPQAPVVRYHDISTQCPRPVDTATPARFSYAPCPTRLARNARTYEITLPNGSTTRRTSSDPGRALLTGVVGGPAAADDWNKLDTNGLHGIRNTPPYFHNNSAERLEDVIDHYIEFFKRVQANAPPGVVPPIASTDGVNFDRAPAAQERAALLAYLKTL